MFLASSLAFGKQDATPSFFFCGFFLFLWSQLLFHTHVYIHYF